MDERLAGFVDRRYAEMPEGYQGYPVYAPSILFEQYDESHLILVASGELHDSKIIKRLIQAGYVENLDFFYWKNFYFDLNDISVPLYAMYTQNRLLVSSTCVIPSTACNLRCRHCLNFTTYLPSFENRDLEVVCKDIDLLFQWIDYTGRLQISGGEPLLYPNLNDLIIYIGEHYRNKIHIFEIVFNGTIIPSEQLCQSMKKYDMTVYLDNYTESIDAKLNRREEMIALFNQYDLNWIDNTVPEWFDLDIFQTDNSGMNEQNLIEYFDMCNNPWHYFEDGKMYACNFARFAMKTGLHEEGKESYYDFTQMNESKKKELLEFTLNYNELGYVQLCKRCAGWADMNPNKVPVAIQRKDEI
mgnify:FL=1